MVRTIVKTKPIIVGVSYRPLTQTSFIDHWEENQCKLRTDCETIILGGYNICRTRKTTHYTNLIWMVYIYLVCVKL